MAVGGKHQPLPCLQEAVVPQHREAQHHLVHLRLAVAPDAEHPAVQAVEQGRHLLGVVLGGQGVAGATRYLRVAPSRSKASSSWPQYSAEPWRSDAINSFIALPLSGSQPQVLVALPQALDALLHHLVQFHPQTLAAV